MKTKSKSFLITVLLAFMFICSIFAITPLTAHAAERDREFPAITSGNILNMSISDDGLLTWDAVDGASGYKVYLKKGSYTVSTFDSETASMALSLIDQTKADSGQYLLEVGAVGVSKSATMQYYYTSNVDKLESPTGLQWLGNNVIWEYVDDTEVIGYTLYLYNFDGLVAKIDNATSPYDLSKYNPQDGWTFQVQAKGNSTLSSKRSSVIVESPAKGTRTKTISEVVTGNSLNMTISSNGMLTWDTVDGATGYKITLKQNGYDVATFETNNTYYFIDTEMNSLKFDSGSYLVEVAAKGVSKSDTMTYFYTSHVDKTESPNGLQWLGYNAIWNVVEGATSYTVSLYNFSGLVTTAQVDGTLYNFEGNLPQDGWTFKVQANGGGTFNSKRDSTYTESPAFIAPKYDIGIMIANTSYDGVECGQVYLQTNKDTVDWTSISGFSRKATFGTTVTIKAQPNVGYEFLGWKLNDDWVSNELEYQFTANENRTYYALFQVVDYYFIMQPTDHTVAKEGTINVEWSTNFIPTKNQIQYFDGEIWDEYDVNNELSSKIDSYDFKENTATKIRFRIASYLEDTVVAYSEEFTISWVEPDIALFEATITAPVGGEHPSSILELANPDMYSYRLLSWYDTVTGNKLSNSDTFIAGRKYRLNVIIEAKEGYNFTNTAVYKVNNVSSVGDGVYKDFYFIAAEPVVETYNVIYNPGEGQGSVDLDYSNAGKTITLKTPQELGFVALDGKMFDAWEINETRYEPGDEYVINANTIIKALWKNIPHTCVGVLQSGQGATCSVNGWKDYYQCEGCGNYFADENCQTLINDIETWKTTDGKIVAEHTGTASWIKTATTHEKKYDCCGDVVINEENHDWNNGVCSECEYVCLHTNIAVTKKDGQGATCTVDGYKDYYQCACGKLFADENCTMPIDNLDTWKANDGKILAKHEYGNLIPEESAVHTTTELKAGLKAHYYCSVCETYFDENKVETTLLALTIAKPEHVYGNFITSDSDKHWKQCTCGLKSELGDHDYTDELDTDCNTCGHIRNSVHVHGNGVKQDGKTATCTENGWKDYYKCICNQLFADVDCTIEISALEDWKNGDGKILASHNYGELIEEVKATCSATGKQAHYHCSVCGTFFNADKEVKTENELIIAIDETAHIYGDYTSNGDGTHTRVCSLNNQHTETTDCSGGTATCTAKAICEHCNTAYGNTVLHNHGTAWENNADEHWNECSCGDKANVGAHVDSDNNGKCDTCDYQMSNGGGAPETPEQPKDGLGTGAIVGIVVGGVVVLGFGGFALVWFVIKKKSFADLVAIFKKK